MKTKKVFSMLFVLTMVIGCALSVCAAPITLSQPLTGDDSAANSCGIDTAVECYSVSPGLTLTKSKVTVKNLYESAVLVVASYKEDMLLDIKKMTVSKSCEKTISSMGLNLKNADEIKAFLWKNMSGIKPVCESKYTAYGSNMDVGGDWVILSEQNYIVIGYMTNP